MQKKDCEFLRKTDESVGLKICEMSHPELETFLTGVANRGAASALAAVGLGDESAGADIRDVRDLMKGFRLVRKEAWTTTLKGLGRIIGWAAILALAALFIHGDKETAKQIAQHLAEP